MPLASPITRRNSSDFPIVTTVIFLTASGAGRMTVTAFREKPDHSGPVNVGSAFFFGAAALMGLPEAHFTTGMPRLSTSTAVPAWSTVAAGFTRPW